ncbi:hypothetical protein ACVWWN_003502 [Mycobacterium sp. URHB0021]
MRRCRSRWHAVGAASSMFRRPLCSIRRSITRRRWIRQDFPPKGIGSLAAGFLTSLGELGGPRRSQNSLLHSTLSLSHSISRRRCHASRGSASEPGFLQNPISGDGAACSRHVFDLPPHDAYRCKTAITTALLVNAGGFFIPKAFVEYEPQDYDSYMDLNHALFFRTQTIVAGMNTSGQRGAIVDIGSMWAHQALGVTDRRGTRCKKPGCMRSPVTWPSSWPGTGSASTRWHRPPSRPLPWSGGSRRMRSTTAPVPGGLARFGFSPKRPRAPCRVRWNHGGSTSQLDDPRPTT